MIDIDDIIALVLLVGTYYFKDESLLSVMSFPLDLLLMNLEFLVFLPQVFCVSCFSSIAAYANYLKVHQVT